jgi:hypothetical protein
MAAEFSSIQGTRLPDGYLIESLQFLEEPLLDPAGRPAVALTRIVGRELRVVLSARLNDQEKSVSLYHEILEAMTVAVAAPPPSVVDFNEADFERAGYDAHERFGPASPETLNRMLQFYGFGEG